MDSSLLKKLLSSLKCDQCGQPYEAHNIKVIGRQEGFWFLTAYCPSCSIQYLVVAVIKEEKGKVITDLTQTEISKLKRGRISADYLLDMHGFLADFDGNFARLFNKK